MSPKDPIPKASHLHCITAKMQPTQALADGFVGSTGPSVLGVEMCTRYMGETTSNHHKAQTWTLLSF